jgi:hypothetical protein
MLPKSSHTQSCTATTTADHTLWPNHPDGRRSQRCTQADVILSLLRDARCRGVPLGLPTILNTRISQYCARIAELRSAGYRIENRLTRVDGVVHSSYVLVHDPEIDAAEVRP